jgi:zinc transport system substrate-binding protein
MLKKRLGLGALLWLSSVAFSAVQAANVVVSIPPLAGLIAPLLSEDDQLHVLLQPGVSPHGFQLKPSHLKQISEANLLVAVGSPVDQWMHKASAAQSSTPHITMLGLDGVLRLHLRQGGLWESHRAKDDGHQHEHEHALPNTPNSPSASKTNMAYDGHLWMSWHNALLMVKAVSQQLQTANPNDAAQIQQRTQAWLARLVASQDRIAAQLQPLSKQGFLVLHDAFQYYETQFGLHGVGSIRLNPELPPSLKRIGELRDKIQSGQVQCIFKEPQFPEKNVLSVVQGLSVKVGELDPMGTLYVFNQAKLTPNQPKRDYVEYDVMMQALADAFTDCLTR